MPRLPDELPVEDLAQAGEYAIPGRAVLVEEGPEIAGHDESPLAELHEESPRGRAALFGGGPGQQAGFGECRDGVVLRQLRQRIEGFGLPARRRADEEQPKRIARQAIRGDGCEHEIDDAGIGKPQGPLKSVDNVGKVNRFVAIRPPLVGT